MKSDEKILKEIGERLKKLRIEKGYTSYESFAVDNDLSRMQYWRMEAGISNITIKSLTRILRIHDITVEEFFEIKLTT
jgi:transcriptional regulator with XRE-family HTH domain